ncbi:MAG: methyltransferase domain-containing protein [Chloroflexi bacterium]|nr:methyltransferase domain-containing protein [Chloroflexota bacterium]
MADRDTDWVRRYWDRSAGAYDSSMGLFERLMLGDGRRWIGHQAKGDVLEIAIGTGLNLPEYPLEVRLTGIDLSPQMLRRAKQRAVLLGREVDLSVGDAQKLDLADGRFDTVIFSLALCSIPDDRAAIREAKRVLRPGGKLLLMEHVRSPRRSVRVIERLVDIFTSRFQGDHMLREPLEHLRREGFFIEHLSRSSLGIIEHAVARKPGPTGGASVSSDGGG